MILKTSCRIVLLALLVFSGCMGRSSVINYYTLNAAARKDRPVEAGTQDQRVIGLGPLTLPDYLDRSAMVTRSGPNRVTINDSHRWAAALDSEILRVMAQNLETLTGARRVMIFPWAVDASPDLRLRIDIQSFEGGRGDTVYLKANWRLTTDQQGRPAVQRVSVIETPVRGENFDALAAAMGEALGELSRQMAEAVSRAVPDQGRMQ